MTNTPTQAAIEAAARAIDRKLAFEVDSTVRASELTREEQTIVAKAAIEAYRAAMREAGEGWQPIETAPRDREILVGSGEYCVASAIKRMWGPSGSAEWYYCTGGYTVWQGPDETGSILELDFEPTHWMPLPNPPSV